MDSMCKTGVLPAHSLDEKMLKILCLSEFKSLLDKVISIMIQLTNGAKYKGLLGHSAFMNNLRMIFLC